MNRFFIRYVLSALLLLPFALPASASEGSCYGYLTEMVRSSDFPFQYVGKDKVNLLIDEDNGDMVRAQLFFDTDGTGTIGWIKYTPATRVLLNTSAELDEPVTLSFDARFADGYAKCLTEKQAG
ncbi:hypothetical protein JFT91_05150 [Pseudomonas sp. TH08]|uniref:hypothetical protein n=1 Tax=unclassified Pseudomonas TaxID=196821 RepID=UPI001911AC3F|nr:MULTISPECIES: hypothetical protein [unclassified Pseudomonas]MBK5509310.1 hypothetical protein [Pseudomonas sp. TH15]MBK5531996.1 hypothetical protein [Pseudomonas sp. TH08]